MSDPSAFTKLVPGFDFLQTLVKNAGTALPGIGQWVAPTLNPEELEKRISELRTVQFWLEQNARMLGATIQALEVQRMTLSTLKTMNVQMGDLRDAMTLKMPEAAPKGPALSSIGQPLRAGWPMPAAKPEQAVGAAAVSREPAQPAASTTPAAALPGAVDPMQWWTALTQQFTQLAAHAIKEGAGEPAAAVAEPGAGTANSNNTATTDAAAAGSQPPADDDPAADAAADTSGDGSGARRSAPRKKPAGR